MEHSQLRHDIFYGHYAHTTLKVGFARCISGMREEIWTLTIPTAAAVISKDLLVSQNAMPIALCDTKCPSPSVPPRVPPSLSTS